MLKRFLIFLFFVTICINAHAEELKNCEWENKKGTPCITISKTPNTSVYSEKGVNKIA